MSKVKVNNDDIEERKKSAGKLVDILLRIGAIQAVIGVGR